MDMGSPMLAGSARFRSRTDVALAHTACAIA
jgi:hypothetical protein